jgi:hypothetical protein
VPASAPPHAGQHGARHRHEAKDIRLEEVAHVALVCFLNRRPEPVAGVVHQHVDRPEASLRGARGGLRLRRIAHVELKRER